MTTPRLEEATEPRRRPERGCAPSDPETGKAVGLAAATMGANLVAVVFTVIFTRLLGADDYGSLAALLNLSVILLVPGSALQVVAVREATLGRLGRGGELAGTLARWSRHILIGLAAIAAVSVAARAPLADLINVDQEWAAAAVPVTGVMWLLLCVQRGLLQSARAYREVGLSILLEALGRLAVGARVRRRRPRRHRRLPRHARLARGRRGGARVAAAPPARTAGARRAPASAARAGARRGAADRRADARRRAAERRRDHGQARARRRPPPASTRRRPSPPRPWSGSPSASASGCCRRPPAGPPRARDPRPVLARGLAVIAALSACALTIFALVPELLLRTAFGAEYESGADVLLTLGVAYALLAVSYLCVQFQLGLHRRVFVLVLALMAVVEPLLLLGAGDLDAFARTVLAVHAVTAVGLLLAIAVRRPAMTATSSCGICSGPLRFLYPGEAPAGGSDAFAPSCHAVSGHGDLYACARCWTGPAARARVQVAVAADRVAAGREGVRAASRRLAGIEEAQRARADSAARRRGHRRPSHGAGMARRSTAVIACTASTMRAKDSRSSAPSRNSGSTTTISASTSTKARWWRPSWNWARGASPRAGRRRRRASAARPSPTRIPRRTRSAAAAPAPRRRS